MEGVHIVVQCKVVSLVSFPHWKLQGCSGPELIVVVGKNAKYSHLSSCSSAGLARGPAGIPPSVGAAGAS